MEYQPLDKFKKENGIEYISWIKSSVKSHGLWYKIKNINIGGKNYPYVCVPENIKQPKPLSIRDIKLSKETVNKINEINKYKADFKGVSFLIDNNEYFILGIGDKSVKAIKNDNDKEEYFWYHTKEGKKLLNHLYGKIGQSILQIIE